MDNLTDRFIQAQQHHQAGDLTIARILYSEILDQAPDHAQAMCLMGVLAYQQGDMEEALSQIHQAITLAPAEASFYAHLGALLNVAGRQNEAISAYQSAITLNPSDADALNCLGNLLQGQGQSEAALVAFQQAIAVQPDFPEAYNNIGSLYQAQNLLQEALQFCQKAIDLKPEHYEAHNNMGTILQAMDRSAEAIRCYEAALMLAPHIPEIHYNLGHALQSIGHLTEAKSSYEHVIALNPDFAMAYNNLGNLLLSEDTLEEAKVMFQKAISANPGYAEAYNNLGSALLGQGQFDAAREQYEQAIQLNPQHPEFNWNRGLLLLQAGDFHRGWPEYEWRFKRDAYPPRPTSQPTWDGSALTGKTILVMAEQGFGDTLQFIRFLPQVKAHGGCVLFEIQPELACLFPSYPGVDSILPSSAPEKPVIPHDVCIPLMSLPGLFQTNLDTLPPIAQKPSVHAARVLAWQEYLSTWQGYKVGIVWSGNPGYAKNKERTCPLSQFDVLISLPNLQLFSLQKGDTAAQHAATLSEMEIIDLAPRLTSFTETAAAITNLDLVITVDTAVAHLSGSLGKATWLLLNHSPDWRWLLQREDSPWYSGMRLFRQSSPGDWASIFASIATALSTLQASHPVPSEPHSRI